MAYFSNPYAGVPGVGYATPAFGNQMGGFGGASPMPGAPSVPFAGGFQSSFGVGGVHAVTPTPGAIASFPSSRNLDTSARPPRAASSFSRGAPARASARVSRYNSDPVVRRKVSVLHAWHVPAATREHARVGSNGGVAAPLTSALLM